MLETLDRRFAGMHNRSLALLESIPADDLFRKAPNFQDSMVPSSCGEYVLRSAGTVEQTAGGITTRLWDDPFEWTLPEKLSTVVLVVEYLHEVESTRLRAFRFLNSDADLNKQIPAPKKLRTIFDLLLETVTLAEHYQGRAFAFAQVLSGVKPTRL
jgi:hypothetical protein